MPRRRRGFFRRPSIRGRIAARTSWKRYVRHSLGFKAPRGWGWLTNPRRAAYNRVYYRTSKGCLIFLPLLLLPLAGGIALIAGHGNHPFRHAKIPAMTIHADPPSASRR